jgi:hypothetical protein
VAEVCLHNQALVGEVKIAVSAGHYPVRPGAIWGAWVEHTKAVEWRDLIVSYLNQRGTKALSVPAYGLTQKIALINAEKCTLAVEVHFNSDPGSKGKGSETLFCPGSAKGEELADELQRAISPFCAPNRGAKPGWYRMDLPGHVDYKGDVEGDEVKDAFLSKTNCTALILEPYFIHEGSKIDANAMAVCDVIAGVLFSWSTK